MKSDSPENQLPIGNDLIVIFIIIAGLSIIVNNGTIFSYIAIVAASGLRNLYFGWLGSGVLFYLVVAVFLVIEALVLTGIHRIGRFLID